MDYNSLPIAERLLPFWTLLSREVRRFTRIWFQTLATPIITTSLYLLIFGVSLGRFVAFDDGVPYLHFIVPGLVIMGVINASAQSMSFSIFLAKLTGTISDTLLSPIGAIGASAAYTLAGTVRGLIIGIVISIIGMLFGAPLPASLLLALTIAFLTGWIFTVIGSIVGIFAKEFEHIGAFTTFALLPLIYLGGVFYSLTILPPTWQLASKINPLFYMIDAFRFAYLGISDISPWASISIIAVVAVGLTIALGIIFHRGIGLRT